MRNLTDPPFEIAVTVTVDCSIPDCLLSMPVVLFEGKVSAGERLPVFPSPPGWNVLNGVLLCPRHKITIFNVVDGMPVVLKGVGF